MDVEQRARELLVTEYRARGELVHAMNIEKGGLSVMYAAEIAAIIAALTPPEEPDQALLVSMAVCLDHGFGMATLERQESRLRDMRKLWDEVMERGYYSPENRERYVAMLAARPEVKP